MLIIYSKDINNNNLIQSNGVNGYSGADENRAGGGGSGAGSINIFYKISFKNKGSIKTDGGEGGSADYKGGSGGTGSVTIGSILTGNFEKIINND